MNGTRTNKPVTALIRVTLVLVLIAVCIPTFAFAVSGQSRQTVRVGFFSSTGYHVMADDGTKSGYGYDFLQMLLRYEDWDYEYVGYDDNWPDMLGKLDSGAIDMVTLTDKTPEREAKYAYSDKPIGTSSTILTASKDNGTIDATDVSTLNGVRVGLVANSSHNAAFETYAAEQGFTYTEVMYDNIDILLSDLRAGQNIDLAATSNMRVVHDETILAEFDPCDYYAIVRKDDTQLLEQLNQAIAQLDLYSPNWRSDLYQQYYSNVNNEVISLSAAEREYLEDLASSGTVIHATMNPELAPYSYYENGQARGIAPELFEQVANKLGLTYDILPAATRAEYKEQLTSGEAQIDLTAYQDFGIAEQYGLTETGPYLSTYLSMVTRSDTQVDMQNMTVATVDDPTEFAGYNDTLIYAYSYRTYDTLDACVDAVKRGECDALFAYAYCAERIVSTDFTHKLQYTVMPDCAFGLTIGVQRDLDHRLLSVLSKGVASLPATSAQAAILEAGVDTAQEQSIAAFIYNNPILCAGIAAAFVLLAATAVILFISNRNKKSLAIANAKLNRFIGYICESYDLVAEMNLADRIRTDYYMKDGKLVAREYPYVPLVRKDYEKIAHPEDIDTILNLSNEERVGKMIDAGGGQDYYEVQILDETGHYRWYSYILKAIAPDAQHPRNYMLFKRDIQEQKDTVEQQKRMLQDALEAARSASAAKGRFLSRMSHEIRTPLNAIIGYTSLAHDADASPDQVMRCVDNTEIAARHLLAIINDVLDISSIESGHMVMAHEDFNLKELVAHLSTLFHGQATEAGVTLEVQIHGATHEWVEGDKLRVGQILSNLLGNAVKFTPAGGTVTLCIDQLREDQEHVYLRFTVADTGIGMSEEFKQRLFTPFEQEDVTTAERYGGTGLGLSITQNLVEMMGGRIDVASVLGKGSTFTVTLHFNFAKESSHEQPTADMDFSHVRVLVVDDSEDEGTYVKSMLKRCNVKSDSVTSGVKALRRIQTRMGTNAAYDMCIIDWKMPEMNGLELASQIREKFTEDITLIVATAYDVDALTPQAREVGVTRVVAKPLFPSTLVDVLASSFGQVSAERARKKTVSPSDCDLTGMHLLLAEDNKVNRDISVTLLCKRGAEVDCAEDGQIALDAFLESPEGTYDAILMDIQMPNMNGYECTHAIRASNHPQALSIPIIAVTANAFAEDVAEALSAGMNAHIAKPIDFSKLCDTLRKFVKK